MVYLTVGNLWKVVHLHNLKTIHQAITSCKNFIIKNIAKLCTISDLKLSICVMVLSSGHPLIIPLNLVILHLRYLRFREIRDQSLTYLICKILIKISILLFLIYTSVGTMQERSMIRKETVLIYFYNNCSPTLQF